MYDDAHDTINYELKFFKVTTAEQFKEKVAAGIEQALNQTSSQASYS